MTEIICAVIAGVSTIICAWLAAHQTTRDKKVDARAEQRAKEGRLQLKMINANTQLVVGVAMALKNGHCNGEVESGLEEVKQADEEYKDFLRGIAMAELKK